ncbi:hypothetical protein HOY80DRAFT_940267 [Tuber brumale]|nr:hypothetical protein HOY80DRAFT_940267 [Tuber brumale]
MTIFTAAVASLLSPPPVSSLSPIATLWSSPSFHPFQCKPTIETQLKISPLVGEIHMRGGFPDTGFLLSSIQGFSFSL